MRVQPSPPELSSEGQVLQGRALAAWAWLLGSLFVGADVRPASAYVVMACSLMAASRWSETVRRGGLATVMLLDVPILSLVVLTEGFTPRSVLLIVGAVTGIAWAGTR